jgi:hypothetical protein
MDFALRSDLLAAALGNVDNGARSPYNRIGEACPLVAYQLTGNGMALLAAV